MADGTDRAHLRLAELVAALSLGVDLGFGQPMEHMLRQCLIALRLAERVGLDEQRRADVYYTALLVGVGCHSDAHEQAKWFGDDIALKAGKYDHQFHSVRAAAAGMRQLGSGHAGSHRFRVALEFALSGHREVADMINQHAAMTRMLGEQLGLPVQVLDALGAASSSHAGCLPAAAAPPDGSPRVPSCLAANRAGPVGGRAIPSATYLWAAAFATAGGPPRPAREASRPSRARSGCELRYRTSA